MDISAEKPIAVKKPFAMAEKLFGTAEKAVCVWKCQKVTLYGPGETRNFKREARNVRKDQEVL